MATKTLTLQDIDAAIAALTDEQADLTTQLAQLQHEVDDQPTNSQTQEYSRLQLRLSAIPGQLERLQAQRIEAEIIDLKQRLVDSEPAFKQAAEAWKEVTRQRIEAKWKKDVIDFIQGWLNKTQRDPLESIYRQREQIIERLIVLGAMTHENRTAARSQMDFWRNFGGDKKSEAVYQRIYAEIEAEILARHGLTIPDEVKKHHEGWGVKPWKGM